MGHLKNFLTHFRKDQSGNVLMLVGLSGMALLGSMGLAVDYARVQYADERLQQSVDAAALAGGHYLGSNPGNPDVGRMQQEAQRYLTANFNHQAFNIAQPPQITAQTVADAWVRRDEGGSDGNDRQSGVRFSVNNVAVGNYFMPAVQVFGGGDGGGDSSASGIGASSTVAIAPQQNLDIVFAIDVSGSMNWIDGPPSSGHCLLSGTSIGFNQSECTCGAAAGTGSNCSAAVNRLGATQRVMKRFVDIFRDPTNSFGLVPWDQQVGLSAVQGWGNGDFIAGPYAQGGVEIFEVNQNNAQDYGNGHGRVYSTSPRIPHMTYFTSSAGINTAIDNLIANGNTDSSLGMAWAIRMFENWDNHIWKNAPQAVGQARPSPNRVIILLTDGFNTRFNNPNLAEHDPAVQGGFEDEDRVLSNTNTTSWCARAKNNLEALVVTIKYNIMNNPPAAYATAVNQGTSMLSNCASDGFYYSADNEAELAERFEDLANRLVAVRLIE